MARACETRAALVLCKGVMRRGLCSRAALLHAFWGVPRELHPTAPALQHCSGVGVMPAPAKP